MNIIFISPYFPQYHYKFCESLKKMGANVLAIGDKPYDDLGNKVYESIDEYYLVDNLENYEEVYRAVAFYISKYGRIDFIESQNEFWLETEAKLRTDFNIESGTPYEYLSPMKYKSLMKNVYSCLNIPVAKYSLINEEQDLKQFIKDVDYPIVVKPDNGVGANATYKLSNNQDLLEFFEKWNHQTVFIAEQYIDGSVETFDGLANSNKEVILASSHILLDSIMNSVNDATDIAFYSNKVKGKDIEKVGRKVVEAFDTRSKFFHFEFFRLNKDHPGLAKKGELVGLEVNMRAPGGFIPEMMSYEFGENIYDLWAEMLLTDKLKVTPKHENIVGYIGVRDNIPYKFHTQQSRVKYKKNILEYIPVSYPSSVAMGDHVYLVKSKTVKSVLSIIKNIRMIKDN